MHGFGGLVSGAMLGSWPPADFPSLRASDYEITSSSSLLYNCFAWVARDITAWWEPDPFNEYFWPSGAPREYSIHAFVEAFRTLGYHRCENPSLEPGFEKIALFAFPDGTPTHAARQLADGRWTSKLGSFEDIAHSGLASLEGPAYGSVVACLRRPRP
jgi:hypothetical protein